MKTLQRDRHIYMTYEHLPACEMQIHECTARMLLAHMCSSVCATVPDQTHSYEPQQSHPCHLQ